MCDSRAAVEGGSTVELFEGSTSLGSTLANADGSWSLTLASPLSDGAHNIQARATDGVGNVSALSSALVLTIDTAAPTLSSFKVNDGTAQRSKHRQERADLRHDGGVVRTAQADRHDSFAAGCK